jgi:hypothetical protein
MLKFSMTIYMNDNMLDLLQHVSKRKLKIPVSELHGPLQEQEHPKRMIQVLLE